MTAELTNPLVDRTSPMQRPSDEQIQQWAANQRVFISSTMDDLRDERREVAAAIASLGAQPVLFEKLGARSDDSRQAYISEVRRSQIYVGILSRRYGSRLESGCSATHEEYKEARDNRKELLLFLDDTVGAEERNPELQSWTKELYSHHVLAKYKGVSNLSQLVKTSLVSLATDQLTPWVKLGRLIFQATRIALATRGQRTDVMITTASRDTSIKHQLSALAADQFASIQSLSFGSYSFPVRVVSADETVDPLGVDSLILECTRADDWPPRSGIKVFFDVGGSYTGLSGHYSHQDLVCIALRGVVLGEPPPSGDPFFSDFPRTDFQRLYGQCGDDSQCFAQVARLLIVESVHQHGIVDQVTHVSVGKVGDGGVRVSLSAILPRLSSNVEPETIDIEGDVELMVGRGEPQVG